MSDTFNTDDLSIDFSDVQASSFDAIPSGSYNVAVTDWSKTETKNAGKLPAGTPGINWEFTIQDGNFENRKLWTNHWIYPSTLSFLKGLLSASGAYTEEELAGPLQLDPDRVVGSLVIAKVRQRSYNGEMRNEIKGFSKAGTKPSSGSILP